MAQWVIFCEFVPFPSILLVPQNCIRGHVLKFAYQVRIGPQRYILFDSISLLQPFSHDGEAIHWICKWLTEIITQKILYNQSSVLNCDLSASLQPSRRTDKPCKSLLYTPVPGPCSWFIWLVTASSNTWLRYSNTACLAAGKVCSNDSADWARFSGLTCLSLFTPCINCLTSPNIFYNIKIQLKL